MSTLSTNAWDSIKNFVVAHWHVLLAAIVVVGVVYWWTNRGAQAAISQLNMANQQEITTIQKAFVAEQAQHQQEMTNLQATLDQVQQQYQDAQARLVAQQAQEQAQIIKNYGNDPVGLANLLAEKFGFQVQQ